MIAPASHQLHRLGDELDFANPSHSELQVLLEIAARDLAGNQGLHLAKRFEHAEIQVAPIHERPNEFLVCGLVNTLAHDGASLDPGVPLPVPSMLMQIVLERREAHHQGSRVAERAQTHVDSKDEPILRPSVQQADDLTSEPGEIVLVVDGSRAIGLAGAFEQEHEIDVRREIQFAPAELSHAENDQLRFRSCGGARHPESDAEVCPRRARGGPDASVRQSRYVAQRVAHGGGRHDVPPRNAQHLSTPPAAKKQLCVRRGRCGSREPLVLRVRGGCGFRHPMLHRPCQGSWILDQHRRREFTGCDDPRQFLAARIRHRRIRLAQSAAGLRALPPSKDRFAQDLGNVLRQLHGRAAG